MTCNCPKCLWVAFRLGCRVKARLNFDDVEAVCVVKNHETKAFDIVYTPKSVEERK